MKDWIANILDLVGLVIACAAIFFLVHVFIGGPSMNDQDWHDGIWSVLWAVAVIPMFLIF
jgi:hypothetical protein